MIRRMLVALAVLAAVAAGLVWWSAARERREPAVEPVPPAAPPAASHGSAPLPAPAAGDEGPGGVPRLPAAARPAAPATRRLPFAIGETALYQVEWLGLGAGVSAGTAEFSVGPATAPGGAYAFELLAVTAPWVSTFFQARDWFGSVTTADLFPVEHRQELREGRRHVIHTALFDRAARLVRVGNGPLASPADGVSRPLPAGARDPLGAMYFVRTIEWTPGQTMRLEVSDLGHPVGVSVRADLTEPVKAEGRSQTARRITVRFDSRTVSIPVPGATVWMSTDGRRIPLVAQVESSYGVFRLSLVRYGVRTGARP